MVASALSRPPTPQGTHVGTQQEADPPLTSFTAIAEYWAEEGLAAHELDRTQETRTIGNRSGVAHAKQPLTVLALKPQVLVAVADAQPVDILAMATQQQS